MGRCGPDMGNNFALFMVAQGAFYNEVVQPRLLRREKLDDAALHREYQDWLAARERVARRKARQEKLGAEPDNAKVDVAIAMLAPRGDPAPAPLSTASAGVLATPPLVPAVADVPVVPLTDVPNVPLSVQTTVDPSIAQPASATAALPTASASGEDKVANPTGSTVPTPAAVNESATAPNADGDSAAAAANVAPPLSLDPLRGTLRGQDVTSVFPLPEETARAFGALKGRNERLLMELVPDDDASTDQIRAGELAMGEAMQAMNDICLRSLAVRTRPCSHTHTHTHTHTHRCA